MRRALLFRRSFDIASRPGVLLVLLLTAAAGLHCDGGGTGASGDSAGSAGSAGSGATAGTAGGAGTIDPGDQAAFDKACGSYCDGLGTIQCDNPASVETCKQGYCPTVVKLAPHCLEAAADQFDCLAKGPYECVDGNPTPAGVNDECLPQQKAFSLCSNAEACARYCDATKGLPCGNPDVEDCYDKCAPDVTGDQQCGPGLATYRDCIAMGEPVCDGDRPTVAECEMYAAGYAGCVYTNAGVCKGYCARAVLGGCAPEGAAQCEAACEGVRAEAKAVKEVCQGLYDTYLTCVVQKLVCDGGAVPAPAPGCEGNFMSYESCLGG
jgi:hypothetical protein